jgi:hypothetical protein
MSNFYFGSLDIATLPEPLLFSTTGVYFGKIWVADFFQICTAHALCAGWQATGQPLAFTLAHIYLIWRNDPPDDVFRMSPVPSLGGQCVCLEGSVKCPGITWGYC